MNKNGIFKMCQGFLNGQIVRCLVGLKRALSNVLKIIAVPVDIAKQWPYNSKW